MKGCRVWMGPRREKVDEIIEKLRQVLEGEAS